MTSYAYLYDQKQYLKFYFQLFYSFCIFITQEMLFSFVDDCD